MKSFEEYRKLISEWRYYHDKNKHCPDVVSEIIEYELDLKIEAIKKQPEIKLKRFMVKENE